MKHKALTVAVAASTLMLGGVATVPINVAVAAGTVSAQQCVGLAGNTALEADKGEAIQIAAARVVSSSNAPEYCEITGQIGGRIKFVVQAPTTTWQGRMVQVGGGGFCGTITTAGGASSYLNNGAIVGGDDSGHTSSPLDAEWGYGAPGVQKQIDWGHLAEHLMANTTKVLAKVLYGVAPSRSYFIGCSTGGRQALMEAQRYPDDFDGIVAGAPANRQNLLAPLSQGFRERANHNGQQLIIKANDVSAISAAVLAQCDGLDGVKDSVVNDPRACPLNLQLLGCPASGGSNCLNAAQLDVLKKWYDDPRDSKGRSLYPGGEPVGSESGWAVNAIAADGPAFSAGGQFADQVLRFLGFPTDPLPSYSLYDFNFDVDPPKLNEMAKIYNADNPDMRPFRDSGGKLILWHGFADPLITPFADIDFYEDGVAKMGGLDAVQQWYRFFLLPGVGHCSGGSGPGSVDWFSAISKWVEKDSAPAKVVASGNSMTRPVYPYPLTAKYAGKGDANMADNFVSAVAPRGRGISVVGLATAGPISSPASSGTTNPTVAGATTTRGANLPATGRHLSTFGFVGFGAVAAALAMRRRRSQPASN